MYRKYWFGLINRSFKRYSSGDQVPLCNQVRIQKIHAFLDGIQRMVNLCVGGGHERLARGDLDHGSGSSRQHSQPWLVQHTIIYDVSGLDPPNADSVILLNPVLGCCGIRIWSVPNPDPDQGFLWKENNFYLCLLQSLQTFRLQEKSQAQQSPSNIKFPHPFLWTIYARVKADPDSHYKTGSTGFFESGFETLLGTKYIN